MFRRRRARQVRMQIMLDQAELTIEGSLLHTRPVAGVFRLADATLIEDAGRTHRIGTVEIPAGRVAFWQVLGTIASVDLERVLAAGEVAA